MLFVIEDANRDSMLYRLLPILYAISINIVLLDLYSKCFTFSESASSAYYLSENLRVRALATPVALVFGIRS
ncbi:hypothetical protein ccbrp13_35680 [Ktedonobacteria bacterium brp13]|nr:hypothetical protein ccbrp13_35680 [Ktedonobacteria bacterium brp13]